MLSRTRMLLALPVLLCLLAADWETWTAPDGKFSVKLPGKPRETEKKIPTGVLKVYTVEGDNSTFIIMTAVMPLGDNADNLIDKTLESNKKSLESKGRIVHSNKFEFDGKYPGREFVLELDNPRGAVIRDRMFVADKVFYQVLYVGKDKAALDSKDVKDYYDSFKLGK